MRHQPRRQTGHRPSAGCGPRVEHAERGSDPAGAKLPGGVNPADGVGPTRNGERARLAGLVESASGRLLREFARPKVQPLLDNLAVLGATVAIPRPGRSLASPRTAIWSPRSPCRWSCVSGFVVDETFATRDLVHALLRRPRYRVLVLGADVTHLFAGMGAVLAEVTGGGFPLLGVDGSSDEKPRFGVDRSSVRDARLRRYLHAVEAALAGHLCDNLPLLVVGVESAAVAVSSALSPPRSRDGHVPRRVRAPLDGRACPRHLAVGHPHVRSASARSDRRAGPGDPGPPLRVRDPPGVGRGERRLRPAHRGRGELRVPSPDRPPSTASSSPKTSNTPTSSAISLTRSSRSSWPTEDAPSSSPTARSHP